MYLRFRLLTLASLLAFGNSQSIHAANFPADWKFSQPIQISAAGFLKFALPAETLDVTQPGLDDLRLFDDAGREVAYLIERPAPQPPVTRSPKSFQPVLGDKFTALLIETGLAQPLASLTLQTASSYFLKSAVLEGSRDGRVWEPIGVGEPLFQQPRATRLTFLLRSRAWAFLRVTLDDRRTPAVIFTGATLHAAVGEPAPEAPLAATIVERDELPGETRLTLRLAGANAALTDLALQTSDPLFARPVRLSVRQFAENEVKENMLARDSVSRIDVEGQAAAEKSALFDAVRVPSRELLVTIENGDSPPLNVTGVVVKQRPVFLAFNAPQSGTFHLVSGNANARAPRYDLAALGNRVKAELLGGVVAGARIMNPIFHAPDALADIQPVGAAIDLAKWRFRKRLELATGAVQQLELDLDVLARASRGLADLRVVESGKQLPYVIERTSLQRSLRLTPTLANDPKRPSVTRWELKLPRANLPLTRLDCSSLDALFRRNVTIYEEVKNDRGDTTRVPLGSANWIRTPENKSAKLGLGFAQSPRTDRVWLEIDNGDNAPLTLNSFEVWHATARVLFKTRPDAALQLYYGNPATGTPQYDLEMVARQLLAADKAKARLGNEEMLLKPMWAENESLRSKSGVIFWFALGAVVLLLIVVLAKLLPKQDLPKS